MYPGDKSFGFIAKDAIQLIASNGLKFGTIRGLFSGLISRLDCSMLSSVSFSGEIFKKFLEIILIISESLLSLNDLEM
jgi:hypothetical protein